MTNNTNLNLVEILPCFKWNNIVRGYSNNWFVRGILGSVECQSSFTWHQLQPKFSYITQAKDSYILQSLSLPSVL